MIFIVFSAIVFQAIFVRNEIYPMALTFDWYNAFHHYPPTQPYSIHSNITQLLGVFDIMPLRQDLTSVAGGLTFDLYDSFYQ
jgi:hypothetical protein